MKTKQLKTKVLVFDKQPKYFMFKEWVKRNTTISPLEVNNPERAIDFVRQRNPEVILLGGDVDNDYKAALFCKLLIDNDLHKGRIIFISTWNAEEARVIRSMLPDAFYCPFCESLANIVKAKVKILRDEQRKKK